MKRSEGFKKGTLPTYLPLITNNLPAWSFKPTLNQHRPLSSAARRRILQGQKKTCHAAQLQQF